MRQQPLLDLNNWTALDPVKSHFVFERTSNYHIARLPPVVLVDWKNTTERNQLHVDSFTNDGVDFTIDPAIIFSWLRNNETSLLEISGSDVYEDILVYGESLNQAMEILCEGILPMLWRDCVSDNDENLTVRAEKMVVDLRSRVESS